MKTGKIAAAIGMVVGGVLIAQPVLAQLAQFPTAARRYQAWMARAMDQCSPATISVVTPGSPVAGCIQQNSATDSLITMKTAKLSLSASTGKVTLFGTGFQFGSRVTVQLTLRVTKHGQSTLHPSSVNTVTFEDVTLDCPSNFGFVANAKGIISKSVLLTACLSDASIATGLAGGNIEIIDSALVNVDTGKVFARPGFLR